MKMKTKMKVFAILLAILVLAVGCRRGEGVQDFTIEVGGSTSVAPLYEMFADAYQALHPHINVNIHSTGSSDGVRNAGGLYHIGMTSRNLTPAELGMGLTEYVVAIDGIAVIVNADSPITNLTVEQIHGIYTGAITDWQQITPAKQGAIGVISREAGSGTRGAFEEIVGFQGQLVAGSTELTSTGAVRAGVATNRYAIGYISIGSVDASVRAITVNGVAATEANIRNMTFPIMRPFIALTGGDELHPEVRAFIDWTLSPEGQAIVSRNWVSVLY